MVKVVVEVYSTLREKLGWSRRELLIPSSKALLGDVLDLLPEVKKYLVDEENRIRRGIILLVNGRHAEFTGGLKTPLEDGDLITIFPPSGGGQQP
ncbi:MAG: MoaD family protein [Zestosphaera sp.]